MNLLSVAIALGIAASVASAEPITYQGVLKDAGTTANGSHDFTFQLFNAQIGGGTLTSTIFKTNVQVTDGLFSVQLDFPGFDYNGNIWLQVGAKTSANPTYTTLTPRQSLTAAPSAINHTLEPWSLISNDLYAGDGATQFVVNRTFPSNSVTYFTLGTPAGANQFGGMYVIGSDPNSFPFMGLRNDGGSTAYQYLHGPTGELRFNVSGDKLILDPGGNARLIGNLSTTGNVTASNFLYKTTNTRYKSINSAAFHPIVDGEDYSNLTYAYMNPASGSGYFVAPVDLPHGAVVTSLRFDAYDNDSTVDMTCRLRRVTSSGSSLTMATAITSSASNSWRTFSDSTISPSTIDNISYSYQLYVYCPAWKGVSTRFTRVRIQYTVDSPD